MNFDNLQEILSTLDTSNKDKIDLIVSTVEEIKKSIRYSFNLRFF